MTAIEGPPISPSPVSEGELWAQYRQANLLPEVHDQLRAQLIEHYAPIIRRVIYKLPVHLPPHIDNEDLVGYGTIGLVQAIENYDPDNDRKATFETFARKRIRGAALDAVRNQTALSRGAHERIRTITATYARLEQENGHPASGEEVAESLGITTQRLDETSQLAAWEMFSLDQPLSSGDGTTSSLGDTIEDESSPDPLAQTAKNDMIERMLGGVDHLPERERVLIGLYYVEGLTMQQIAEIFHVTKPRVFKIHNRAILRLRDIMEVESAIGEETYEPPRWAVRRYDQYPIAEPDFPRIGPVEADKTA